MKAKKPVFASDRLVARDTGPWAQEKLARLERYAEMMTTAMKGKNWTSLNFIDLMCGPGMCVDTKSSVRSEFTGSTLRAIETRFPFSRVISTDISAANIDALRHRLSGHERAGRVEALHADCNDTAVINHLRSRTDGGLTLVFVDLIGTEVTMETIARLTHNRAMDLVVTWPEMDVRRNNAMMIEQPERWTAFFGTEKWLSIAKASPLHRVRDYTALYIRQLKAIGYDHHHIADSVKNMGKGRLYRPLFAARDPLGLKFWKAAAPVVKQPRLDGF